MATKPQDLLVRSNRVLADQTNEASVRAISEIIQPVFEVGRLDDDLKTLITRNTMTGAVNWVLLHGPVPLGFEWIYEEINVVKENGIATDIICQTRFDANGVANHINVARGAGVVAFDDVNFTRMSGDPAGPNQYNSTRPIVVYPGMFLRLISVNAVAIGDIFRVLMQYRERPASEKRFMNNVNADNLVVTLA